MAQQAPKKGKEKELKEGAVLPKEPTKIQLLKNISASKAGDVREVHRALAEKLVKQGKARLWEKGMSEIPSDIDSSNKGKGKGKNEKEPEN